jgi:polyhydroxyalkanoate synthase subunit PhaC
MLVTNESKNYMISSKSMDYDEKLTIGHYVNNYLADAIDHITKHTGSDKVSLFGYCWGGNLAFMLAALHQNKIKNIITLATPGDFSIDNNLLSVWTRNINPDTIADTFGNIPGAFINSAFLLRSCKSHFYLVVV